MPGWALKGKILPWIKRMPEPGGRKSGAGLHKDLSGFLNMEKAGICRLPKWAAVRPKAASI